MHKSGYVMTSKQWWDSASSIEPSHGILSEQQTSQLCCLRLWPTCLPLVKTELAKHTFYETSKNWLTNCSNSISFFSQLC